MKKTLTVFQKHCEKALQDLSETCIEQFKVSKDEETRIKLIFDYAKNIPTELVDNGKSIEEAQNEKVKGNNFFAKKDYKNALRSYSDGILKCPQNTDEGKELLTILIANRSATYFELKEYKRVFNDIDYVLEIGKYPHNLQYKIWLRKARCYDALQNEKSSAEAYSQAIESLQFLKLNEKQLADKMKEIENIRKKKPEKATIHNELMAVNFDPNVFRGGKEYIAAHQNIEFEESQHFGRYARAAEDIETGTVIIQENPHCAILDEAHSKQNCQHCMASTLQPIACPGCAHVMFCSSNCEKLANRSYHKYECSILPAIHASGASVNCLMALRIITQKTLKFFKDKRKFLRDFLKDNGKKSIPKKRPYRSDDYDTVFFLCRNEILRKKEELIHFSCMAIHLLNFLKTTDYFGGESKQDILTEDEQFIASLILRHLEILQFSSHEVSELHNTPKEEIDEMSFEALFKSVQIGAALYPTLALFNHSCDPSIVRYNIGNKVVARTIKPIKSGDIIYENYGPIYTTTPKHERQQYLQDRYWFECLCTPCVELWPLLENMDENELRIPCKSPRCPFVFVIHKDDYCPFLDCDYCKQQTSLLPFLKGLMVLQELLPRAEELYAKFDYQNALQMFVKAVNILYQYTSPPCPDMVKVQQRIRNCMVHFGNKSIDYVVGKVY